jgi:tetratricopeptide (TPR) repeat protein
MTRSRSCRIWPPSGNARHRKVDLEGALKDFTEAIRLKPDYALAFFNRAVARRDKGDVGGAQEDFNEAIRLGYKSEVNA